MPNSALPHMHSDLSTRILQHMPHQETFAKVGELLHLLGEENRIRLFWILCHCEECVINLSAMMHMSSPALCHHLKLLKSAGLILSRRDGKEVYYHAADTVEVKLLHRAVETLLSVSCPKEQP